MPTAYEQLEADLAAANSANAELTARVVALDSDLNASYGALDEAQRLLSEVSTKLAEASVVNEQMSARIDQLSADNARLEAANRDVDTRAQEMLASKVGTNLVPLAPAAPINKEELPAPQNMAEFLANLGKISDPLEHAKYYQAHKETVFGK